MTESKNVAAELERLGAPATIAQAVATLAAELEQAAGPNLRGLILYGGLARCRYQPGRSDVNLVVLLGDTRPDALAAIGPPLRAAYRSARVEPLILAPEEVRSAADVFPTKLLDIAKHHVVLRGEDPFTGLEVAREHIRLRIEQELRNLVLRLRRRFVSSADDRFTLARTLRELATPLGVELAALLQLAGRPATQDNPVVAIEEAAKAFDLDRDALVRAATLERDQDPPDDLPAIYGRVLSSLSRAADVADAMEGKP